MTNEAAMTTITLGEVTIGSIVEIDRSSFPTDAIGSVPPEEKP